MDTAKSPSASPKFWPAPYLTVFASSSCIMMVELVAGRLIARYVGMSLYTWTSIIGIIMAGMAMGNHLGGRIADRYPPRRALAVLLLAAAAACAAMLPLNALAGDFSPLWRFSWPVRIFLHVTVSFLCPAIFLGMVNPVAARMALEYRRGSGRTVGGIFACGVAGSLVGTFTTGFFLVMWFGANAIVVGASTGLALLAAAYGIHAFLTRGAPRPGVSDFRERTKAMRARVTDWLPAAATVFASNAAFMMFELAMMRVVAREFGSSLYTWTTVIGVVLAGISLGNYAGGRLADRYSGTRAIAAIFSIAALFALAAPAWSALVTGLRGEIFMLARLSWPVQILIHVGATCFLPCVWIGMVSPVVVRRQLDGGRAPGSAVGMVYAWGSVGAIAGTFLAGYWLIQWMGSLAVVAATASLLATVAVCYAPRRVWPATALALCGFATAAALAPSPLIERAGAWMRLRAQPGPLVVYEDESQYSYIAVLADAKEPNVRELLMDKLIHSRLDLTDPARLLYEYEWIYSAVMEKKHPRPEPVRAMVIGGGGYAYPHYLEHTRPGSEITVAEIDPAVTEAAHKAMGLPRDTHMTIYDMDARNVVDDLIRRQAADPAFERFDYVFGDSINDFTVPYHLTTVEFVRHIYALLDDDGVYLFNMIDMFDSGAFLAAIVNTCRNVFPQVAVFNTGRSPMIRDTFVVVCAKQPMFLGDIPMRLHTQHGYKGVMLDNAAIDALIEKHHGLVLTDDFAPVENLLAPVVRTRAGDPGEISLAFARRYAARGDQARALHYCRRALAIHPRWHEAHELLAELLEAEGDVEGAIDALRAAVDGHPEPATAWFNLGRALRHAGRHQEAVQAWEHCVAADPAHVTAWYNLGTLYAAANDLDRAVSAWTRTLEADPAHADALHNLAAAHVMKGDGTATRTVLDRMRALGIAVDATLEAAAAGLP